MCLCVAECAAAGGDDGDDDEDAVDEQMDGCLEGCCGFCASVPAMQEMWGIAWSAFGRLCMDSVGGQERGGCAEGKMLL